MAASEEQMLSLEEVAERLQVSDQTVRRWIKSGRLSAYKPGLEWRIRPKDLEAFLETRSYPKSSAPSPSAEDSPELRRSPIEAVAAAADVWLRIASHPQIDPKESSVLATAADVLDDQLSTFMGDPEAWGQLSDQEKHGITHLMSRLEKVSAKYHGPIERGVEQEVEKAYIDARFSEIVEAAKAATNA